MKIYLTKGYNIWKRWSYRFNNKLWPWFLEEGEIKASSGLKRILDSGLDIERVHFSSDGQGSLPRFNEKENM